MATPGVEIRPIISRWDGERGESTKSSSPMCACRWPTWWARRTRAGTAQYLLTHERTNITGDRPLGRGPGPPQAPGRPRDEEPASLWIRTHCLPPAWPRSRSTWKTPEDRQPARDRRGGRWRCAPARESSMLKIKKAPRSEFRSCSRLARRALGVHALPYIAEALDKATPGEPIGPRENRLLPRRTTSTTASCRSTAAPTKSRRTSSPR